MSDVEKTEDEMATEAAAERPHLQAVRHAAEDAEIVEPEAGVDEEAPKSRRGLLITLLCASLAVCLFVMILQARKADELQGEISALSSEIAETRTALGAAEAQVAAWETKMQEVRGSVGDLLLRVGALQRLVGDSSGESEPPSAEPAN